MSMKVTLSHDENIILVIYTVIILKPEGLTMFVISSPSHAYLIDNPKAIPFCPITFALSPKKLAFDYGMFSRKAPCLDLDLNTTEEGEYRDHGEFITSTGSCSNG